MNWCALTRKSVYFAAFSILQNEQDAEDAAQEAVLKALKNLQLPRRGQIQHLADFHRDQ